VIDLKLIGLVVLTAIVWALAWGSCGLCMALIGIRFSPDNGHVPHGLAAAIVAFLSAVTGFFSGMVYGLLSRTMPLMGGRRVALGATVGAAGIIMLLCTGAIINSSSANPLMRNLAQVAVPMLIAAPFTALLGGLLAKLDAKIWARGETASRELKTSGV
jgi:hypothetical protein